MVIVQAPVKKSHGCLIAFIVVVVLFFLFGGFLTFSSFFMAPGLVSFIFENIFNSERRLGEPQRLNKYEIENVVSGDITANVDIPAEVTQSSISLKALDKSKWPKDAQGGMYQLEPSGSKFEKPLVMNVAVKNNPGPRFSLGYWLPEKKDWQWIPTIKRGNNYEGRLEHASEVGAYLPDWTDLSDYDYKLTDKSQRDLFFQYQQQLRLLSGEADINHYYDSSQARWLGIKNLLGQLTDSVILACQKEKTPDRQRDFYFIWGVVQWNSFIGLDNLLAKFEQAESQCAYEDQSATMERSYIIEQIDKYPYTANVYNIAKSHGQQKSVYWGLPMNPAPAGSDGWQTDWKVYADTTTDALTDVNIQMAPGSPAGVAVAGTQVSRTVMTFSLKGVKVGEKFPITVKGAGSYEIHSNMDYPKLVYADKQGNLHFDTNYVNEYGLPAGTEEKGNVPQSAATISGMILEDDGARGARIKMQYEGLGPMQDAIENIKNTYEGTDFYNMFFQKGNLDITMDIPPLIIKPADQYTGSPVAPPNTPENHAPYN